MAKHRDIKSAGRSDICPYIEGEDPKKRHSRRLETNLQFEGEVKGFCEKHGLKLTVSNHGQHWQFSREHSKTARQIDWWPSSAKLVYDKNWEAGKHVHDYKQLIGILKKTFCL